MVNSEEFREIQIEESKFEKFNNLKTILEIDSQVLRGLLWSTISVRDIYKIVKIRR